LPSIDEEKFQTRKYYSGDHAAALTILKCKRNDDDMTDLLLAPESPMQGNNDGVSFASEYSRSPSHRRNERKDSTEVFNDDGTNVSYSSSRSIVSLLSGFSSVLL